MARATVVASLRLLLMVVPDLLVVTSHLHLRRSDRQAELTLAQDRVDPRDVVTHGAQSPVVVQLPGGHLEAQVEQLLLGLAQPGLELVVVQLAQLGWACVAIRCHLLHA